MRRQVPAKLAHHPGLAVSVLTVSEPAVRMSLGEYIYIYIIGFIHEIISIVWLYVFRCLKLVFS